MPNHVANRLQIHGTPEDIQKVKEFIKDSELGDGTIDFNKITPMPPWVYCDGIGPKEEEKYGAENCWYDWSIANWGTKWNAYQMPDPRTTEDVIYFTTAWSDVATLISRLAWIFPNVKFEYSYASEDIGYDTGYIAYKDTDIVDFYAVQPETPGAYELAFGIQQTECWDYDLRYDPIVGTYINNKYLEYNWFNDRKESSIRYNSPIVFAPLLFEDKQMHKNNYKI